MASKKLPTTKSIAECLLYFKGAIDSQLYVSKEKRSHEESIAMSSPPNLRPPAIYRKLPFTAAENPYFADFIGSRYLISSEIKLKL